MDSRPPSHRQAGSSVPDLSDPEGTREVSLTLSADDFRLVMGALYLYRRQLTDLAGRRQTIRADEIALVIQDALASGRPPGVAARPRNAYGRPVW